jgi:RNA polymerase sigma factor (sigma-70 family)
VESRRAAFGASLDSAAVAPDDSPLRGRDAEEQALSSILGSLYPWARRLAYFLTGDASAADDLVQDAFVEAVRRPPTPPTEETFRAWLRVVIMRMHLRRRRRLVLEARTLLRLAGGGEEAPRLSEDSVVLIAALRRLGSRQRACVVLRYYEDLPEAEIADVLGIREGTVKAHLAQARSRLRELLGE